MTQERRLAGAMAALASIGSLAELHRSAIPLPGGGEVVPMCELLAGDDLLVADIARWRSTTRLPFAVDSSVSTEGTRRWLRREVLESPGRILFLTCDRFGRPAGHIRLSAPPESDGVEVGDVVRAPAGSRQLQREAIHALVAWARRFGDEPVTAQVLADDVDAVDLFRSLGFVEGPLVPLRLHDDGTRAVLLPCADGDADPADQIVRVMALTAVRADAA